MSVICMRPTAVAVPSHLPTMIARMRDPDYRALASYVTGADAARAFRLALDYDVAFDTLFLSADDSMSDEPTLARAERLFGHLPEVRTPDRFQNEPRASMVDANRARERLGWSPTSRWPDLTADVVA